MKFIFEQELLEYMEQKKKNTIIVEVVSSDSSDIEWTELHVYLIEEKRIPYLVEKKKFKLFEEDQVKVLLPAYRLSYDEEIRFGLKKKWIIKTVSYEGIHL